MKDSNPQNRSHARAAAHHLLVLLLTALLGGLFGATLARVAPGFDIDERELNAHLSDESIHALRHARLADHNILNFYAKYVSHALRGDFGHSWSLNRPVSELIVDRVPVTFRSVGAALALAWSVSLALAVFAIVRVRSKLNFIGTLLSGLLICIPPAMLALPLAYVGGPVSIALALALFPRIFRYSRNILGEMAGSPHVLQAEACGLRRSRIVWFHILANSRTQLLAVAGISVSMALGISVPLEVICDSPGIGQLAWKAALGRDLPLLTTLTVLVSLIAMAANSLSDILGAAGTLEAQ